MDWHPNMRMEAIIEYHRLVGEGRWFAPSAMRFFNCRLLRTTYPGNIFITSELLAKAATPRRYTVRQLEEDGDIETLGDFQQFATALQAQRFIRKHLAAIDSGGIA